MGLDDDALEGLPEPGKPIFYPKVGHCLLRGVTEDRVAPGTRLLELEDMEEGSRILIPLARVPELHLRPAGVAFEAIKEVLSSEFEEPLESEEERQALIEGLATDGSPTSLAKALKRLHLVRQTDGLSREEELTRKKIRSWLAAEVAIARESTRAEAQAFLTRVLQEAMAVHRRREKEEAKQRRRAAREQRKAEVEAQRSDDMEAAPPLAPAAITPEAREEAEPEPSPETPSETEVAPTSEAEPEPDTNPDLDALPETAELPSPPKREDAESAATEEETEREPEVSTPEEPSSGAAIDSAPAAEAESEAETKTEPEPDFGTERQPEASQEEAPGSNEPDEGETGTVRETSEGDARPH